MSRKLEKLEKYTKFLPENLSARERLEESVDERTTLGRILQI